MLMDISMCCLGYKFNAMRVLFCMQGEQCCEVDNSANIG